MSNSSNHSIVQIYKSRKTILEILENVYQYDITEYSGFSLNEIDAMYANDQLDMLLTIIEKNDKNAIPVKTHKTYIKYFLQNSTLNEKSLSLIVEDLFSLTDTLSKEDTLIIIYDGEPNETLQYHLTHMYNHDGIFVVVHNIKRLQFNILEHHLVPVVSILEESQVKELEQKYHLTKIAVQLPEISRYDPMALAICLRPSQVCKLIRSSPTALRTEYYRICI
jgi:DNA-directed RNA polymerase subunit H (RpoH/RPB5)